MKRIFVDTNVFIDLIMKREDYLAAAKFFSFAGKGYTLHASVLTMANIAYILRKAVGKNALYDELEKFNGFISIESLTNDDYQKAIALKPRDFEDALQYMCALSAKCDLIVTRNKKDFCFDGIEAVTPSEFLKMY